MGLGESDLQAQHQGEDELWEAQFIAERSALVSVFHDSNSTYMCVICIIFIYRQPIIFILIS